MKKHFLILLLPFLLALGLVTVALAAAQSSVPGAQSSVPGAQSSVPGAQNALPPAVHTIPGVQSSLATDRYNPAGAASQPSRQSRPADSRQVTPRSNSALIPGFLQAYEWQPSWASPATVTYGGETSWRSLNRAEYLGDWDGNGIYAPAVITDSGMLKMWYSGSNIIGVGRIGYAESSDGILWTRPTAEPVVDLGVPGEWDDKGVGQPSVIKNGSLYQMWYFGASQAGAPQIGYATSSDGLSWTKYAGNPVLTVGDTGEWDESEAGGPWVVYDGATYHLWYHGYSGTCCDSIGYATSPDGYTWTKYASNPVFGPDPGQWDESFIFFTSVLTNTGQLHMWYSVDGGSGLGYVTSTNGINWTRFLTGPVLTNGGSGEWDENFVFAPTVVYAGGLYHMWYTGYDANWKGKFGYATSADGVNWAKSASNPVFAPGAPGLVLLANYSHDWVTAKTVPNTPITVTVEGKGWVTGTTDGGGEFRSWDQPWYNDVMPDIAPGDVITAVTPGAATEINPLGTIDGMVDVNADTIAGTIYAPFGAMTLTVRCEIWVENGPPPILVAGIPANGGSYTCDFGAAGWDIQVGQQTAVSYFEPDGDAVMGVFDPPWMRVNSAHDWAGGNYPAGHTFWITVTDSTGGVKATTQAFSLPGAGWGGDGFDTQDAWVPQHPDIQEGDWVSFASDDGYSNAVQAGVITGTVVADNDSVSGSVYADWFTEDLSIECHPWGAPGGAPGKNSSAGPDGEPPYLCQWDPLTEWDVQPGQEIAVMYIEPDGDRVINVFEEPTLVISSNYGHDWVEGNFEAGHTMWITLTNSLGEVKATASGVTGPIDWWGGQSGFSTNANVPWLGSQPDMQAGDWVYASMDNGLTAVSQLGELVASADVNLDSVSGTLYVPWYPDPMRVDCGIWEDGAPGMSVDDVDPNGGAFTCDFAGQWDIIPGNQIGVSYNEPDGDQVINMASNPAPRLRIQTWADGQPAAGSNFSFYVQYRNYGDAPTQNATISAVLDGGMTYLGDTSGLPVNGAGTPGDPLVWQLGTLQPDPYSETRFYLFVQVTAATGDWITNTVQIENGAPYDQDEPWDKISWWSRQVVDNDTDMTLDKSAWTWDPVPGSQFVYRVNVCNKGSTDSAEVVVTDTLPLSTTLLSWWGQQPGWEEASFSDHQLVVSLPSFMGHRCSEVYLRVELDASAWEGMPLHNVANVDTSNDLNPDNDQTEIWHNVGAPHTNLSIHKEWNWGELVPGGEIRYNVNYNNNGNLPVDNVVITETLPASTTFVGAFWYDDAGGHLFTPTLVTDEIVVWEIGALDNGYGFNFEVILDIDPQALPGLELVNTADITRVAGEDNYDDNTSTWTEILYDHGPNLRIRKNGDWHGHGEGHNAWYNIIVENVGDVAAEHVTVTDTLPVSFTLDGDPNTDWSQVESYVRNDAEGWFSFTYTYLHPNWRRDINMNVVNPSPDPVPGGLFFTNQAQITPLEGEPTYADNTSEYTLASGPDLYVEKSLVAGEILPDAEVTFSLVFGNQQVGHAWWWNLQGSAWLTDTLPAGTEFITATLHWCGGNGDWCPLEPIIQDDDLTWQLWPINTGGWNEIYVTVRLPDTLTGLDTVVNQATIASDQPEVDIEPYYDNNTSIYQADVLLPYFEVDKVYQSSTVAGMPVVYTLTVSNIGNQSGTSVEVWDWIPDWVDYGGGGSYNAGLITWTLPSIGADSEATAWFTGTLSCSAGGMVNNQYYFVNSSDQGITSTYGTPVAFTIVTPTIEVSFAASALAVFEGETVYFTGTASTDGTGLTYAWDFGGDGTAAGLDASHAFSADGSYAVTLTVTDGCGYSAEYTLTVEVTASTQLLYLPLVRK